MATLPSPVAARGGLLLGQRHNTFSAPGLGGACSSLQPRTAPKLVVPLLLVAILIFWTQTHEASRLRAALGGYSERSDHAPDPHLESLGDFHRDRQAAGAGVGAEKQAHSGVESSSPRVAEHDAAAFASPTPTATPAATATASVTPSAAPSALPLLRPAKLPHTGENAILQPRACAHNLNAIMEGLRPAWRWRGKGLFVVAAGTNGARWLRETAPHFLERNFDVAVLAFDNHTWVNETWTRTPRVRIIAEKGFKFPLAVKHFPAAALREGGYSHLLLWDDDIRLLPSFDADEMLMLLQAAPHVRVAAPFVTGDCHFACWVEKPAQAHALITTPETMVPAYSIDAWECLSNLVDASQPEAWGVDSVAAGCLCAKAAGTAVHTLSQLVLLQHGVEHMSGKSLTGTSAFNFQRARSSENRIVGLAQSSPGGNECIAQGRTYRGASDWARTALGACFDPIPADEQKAPHR
jgi:hypothetical protein